MAVAAAAVERPKSRFADFLDKLISTSDKTQREIASDLGYDKPNIITMFKQGLTRVPIEKVPALADSLGVNVPHMLNMAMREYMPGVLEVIQKYLGFAVTETEQELVEEFRKANPKGKAVDTEFKKFVREWAKS